MFEEFVHDEPLYSSVAAPTEGLGEPAAATADVCIPKPAK